MTGKEESGSKKRVRGEGRKGKEGEKKNEKSNLKMMSLSFSLLKVTIKRMESIDSV